MELEDVKSLKRLLDAVALAVSFNKSASDTTLHLFGIVATEPGVPQAGLARRLDIGGNTVSTHLGYLRDAGLVRAEPSVNNANAFQLYLTPQGEAFAEKIIRIAQGGAR